MKPLIIGVAGGTGSGKSTVARNVAQALHTESVAFIDMDAYYLNFAHLPFPERRKINWDHPDAFDWELLIGQLACLAAGDAIEKPVYDFVSHTRSDRTVIVPPVQVVVIDGILLFSDPRVRDLCDVKVRSSMPTPTSGSSDASAATCRNVRPAAFDEILDQYLTTVQPMHLQFVEPSKRYADVIVPRGGHNSIAIEMIVAKIQRRLAGSASARSAAP